MADNEVQADGTARVLRLIREGFKGLVIAPGQTLACVMSLAVARPMSNRATGRLQKQLQQPATSGARELARRSIKYFFVVRNDA